MICSNYLFAQDDSSAIRDAMNKQIEAWNNGDIDTFMQTYWKSDSADVYWKHVRQHMAGKPHLKIIKRIILILQQWVNFLLIL